MSHKNYKRAVKPSGRAVNNAGKQGRSKLTPDEKKKLRDILIILLETLALAVPYYIAIQHRLMWGMVICYIAAAISGALFAVLHFSALYASDEKKRARFIKYRRRILFVFMPLLLIIFWDTVILFIGDYIKDAVGL